MVSKGIYKSLLKIDFLYKCWISNRQNRAGNLENNERLKDEVQRYVFIKSFLVDYDDEKVTCL